MVRLFWDGNSEPPRKTHFGVTSLPMIRIQPTSSDSDRLLIGSDLDNAEEANVEIENWVKENNCRVPETPRRLAVYEHGVLVREWVLVERAQEVTQNITSHLFHKFWQRKSAREEAATGKCEVIHLRFDKAA